MAPKVSVIVLNYNGTKYVDNCLRSILRNSYFNFEIIFVDNDSNDDSWERAKAILSNVPEARLIKNRHNMGYAGGNNVGAACAKGEYLFFLNIDTEVDPNCLKALVEYMERNPAVAVAQPKLLLMHNTRRLDACGAYLTNYGFLHHIGLYEEDSGQFDKPFEVLSIKGAAFMVRSQLFKRVGGFDIDYFMYYEEHDLCLRLRLLGYSIVYFPTAIVYHAWGGVINHSGMKQMILYYMGYRNYIQTFLKTLSVYYIVKLLVPYLIVSLFYVVYSSVRISKLELYYAVKAFLWILRNWRKIYNKRVQVQRYCRKLPDKIIIMRFLRKTSLLLEYNSRRMSN